MKRKSASKTRKRRRMKSGVSSKAKKLLSNPRSTGGVGFHFEAHVQASFVALMLTGGYAPALPCWPIRQVKLQGKIDGFDTDDLVVYVRNGNTREECKLLGQIKHSIGFTKGNTVLAEVMYAAWSDFNNTVLFDKRKDAIALITGPLNETDAHNVVWLLDQARHTKDSAEFFRNVNQTRFSPSKAKEKLDVFRHHLKGANGNKKVADEVLYIFLNRFYLLGYDLGKEVGVVLSLLHSHISQFNSSYPQWAWSRVVDIVETWNQDAGTVTLEKLPQDLRDAFKQRPAASIPAEYVKPDVPRSTSSLTAQVSPLALAIAALVGQWDESNESDLDVIKRLIDGL
ncbi:MAG: hypothetical protein OEW15_06160 [Nitrospirota bacterium]|nr:hypothetical protein [Nitrospirota bacterium]